MLAARAIEPIPLSLDSDGVIRVAGTRVTLETVLEDWKSGATPEEIAQDFPVLHLDDVYAVVTYYLRHRAEAEDYLARREVLAEQVRREGEDRFSQAGLRELLLSRLARA